jgi:uncharacterized protein (UPF0305 family)
MTLEKNKNVLLLHAYLQKKIKFVTPKKKIQFCSQIFLVIFQKISSNLDLQSKKKKKKKKNQISRIVETSAGFLFFL